MRVDVTILVNIPVVTPDARLIVMRIRVEVVVLVAMGDDALVLKRSKSVSPPVPQVRRRGTGIHHRHALAGVCASVPVVLDISAHGIISIQWQLRLSDRLIPIVQSWLS